MSMNEYNSVFNSEAGEEGLVHTAQAIVAASLEVSHFLRQERDDMEDLSASIEYTVTTLLREMLCRGDTIEESLRLAPNLNYTTAAAVTSTILNDIDIGYSAYRTANYLYEDANPIEIRSVLTMEEFLNLSSGAVLFGLTLSMIRPCLASWSSWARRVSS